jgi:hypothetical protein
MHGIIHNDESWSDHMPCMTICKRRIHVSELESHPLFAQISIMAWRIRMLWSSTDFKSVL